MFQLQHNNETLFICIFLRLLALAITKGTCLYTGGHGIRTSCAGQSQGEHVPLVFLLPLGGGGTEVALCRHNQF